MPSRLPLLPPSSQGDSLSRQNSKSNWAASQPVPLLSNEIAADGSVGFRAVSIERSSKEHLEFGEELSGNMHGF
jgi:hypothetical protein